MMNQQNMIILYNQNYHILLNSLQFFHLFYKVVNFKLLIFSLILVHFILLYIQVLYLLIFIKHHMPIFIYNLNIYKDLLYYILQQKLSQQHQIHHVLMVKLSLNVHKKYFNNMFMILYLRFLEYNIHLLNNLININLQNDHFF